MAETPRPVESPVRSDAILQQLIGSSRPSGRHGDIGRPASARTLPPRPMKQTPAARSIQCRARWKRRITGPDDMNRLTQEYQTRDDAVTRAIISTISERGVEAVTAVAKTLANST